MEKITPEYIKDIVASGESDNVEFKERLSSQHSISSVFSSFANSKGGIVLVGVKDNNEIVGVPEEYLDSQYNQIVSVSGMMPSVISSYGIQNIDNKNVIYAVVNAVNKDKGPILTSRGEFFVRTGSETILHREKSINAIDVQAEGRIHIIENEIKLFIAMSFREEEEPALVDYYKALCRAINLTGLPIKQTRIDLCEGDFEISQKIMTEIDSSDIFIADFTLNPYNVYFELGYARGKKVRIIQTARKGTNLEFDVRNWKTIFYRNATELEEKVKNEIEAAYRDIIKPS